MQSVASRGEKDLEAMLRSTVSWRDNQGTSISWTKRAFAVVVLGERIDTNARCGGFLASRDLRIEDILRKADTDAWPAMIYECECLRVRNEYYL